MVTPAKAPTLLLNNGIQMPILALGTWNCKSVENAVKCAILEAGYRHIDCALVYGNEDAVGEGLKEALKFVKRDELFITTKCWNTYHSRNMVRESLKKSLTSLDLEYIDLYLIHWPHGFQEGGPNFPTDEQGNILYSDVDYMETWKGMEDCLKDGLVKSIGLSNFNSVQINRIYREGTIIPVVNQVECHPYLNQYKLLKFCQDKDIKLMAYSPLGSPGKPNRDPNSPSLLDDPVVNKIARSKGKQPAHVLLRYNIQRGIPVIAKSSTPERIKENINVFRFELFYDEMIQLDGLNRNFRYNDLSRDIKHPYYPFSIPF